MPIKDSVTKKEIEESDVFRPAKDVMKAAFKVAAFEHDSTDAGDIYWDMLCDDLLGTLDEWRVACGMERLKWEKAAPSS